MRIASLSFAAAVLVAVILNACASSQPGTSVLAVNDGAIAEKFDWTNRNDIAARFSSDGTERCAAVIGRIVLQGQCETSAVMSLSDTIRDRLCIATKGAFDKNLSAQQLLDCAGDYGCNEDWPETLMDWIESKEGLCAEVDYPYVARQGSCKKQCKPIATISGYRSQNNNQKPFADENAMRQEIWANGPIVAIVDSLSASYQDYHAGVLDICGGVPSVAVRIVGWGIEQGKPFWKIATTWGADWGDHGFIKLAFGKNMCGITALPSAALGVTQLGS